MQHKIFTLGLGLAIALVLGAFSLRADEDKQAKEDLSAFKAFLEKDHAAKKWATGPSRIDTPEIRTAYGDRRFYFVYQGAYFGGAAQVNAPPGFSMTVGIDKKGKLTPFVKPEDFNQALMQIKTDDDAKVAAAAILSLHGSPHAHGGGMPGAIDSKQITVAKDKAGWTCTVSSKAYVRASVSFDSKGKCSAVRKTYVGPQPP